MDASFELLARVERGADGRTRVLSPGVGVWYEAPEVGALVGAGSPIGVLRRLQQRLTLVLPEGVHGIVRGPLVRQRAIPVAYGEPLFELAPIGSLPELPGASSSARAGLPAGAHAVVSPTDGTFYRRPSPDAPPFVEVGSKIRRGQALGLVEVMKTFNQVLYGGHGFPEEAEVVEIRVGESEEVKVGQVLVVVR